MPSIFGAEERICQLSSALAVHTGRHTENTRATLFVWREARVGICNRPVIVW